MLMDVPGSSPRVCVHTPGIPKKTSDVRVGISCCSRPGPTGVVDRNCPAGLGAPPATIRALIFVETAVLAVAGALLGLVVAVGITGALRRLAPEFPRIEELSLDVEILLYTLAAIVVVTAICGLVPVSNYRWECR